MITSVAFQAGGKANPRATRRQCRKGATAEGHTAQPGGSRKAQAHPNPVHYRVDGNRRSAVSKHEDGPVRPQRVNAPSKPRAHPITNACRKYTRVHKQIKTQHKQTSPRQAAHPSHEPRRTTADQGSEDNHRTAGPHTVYKQGPREGRHCIQRGSRLPAMTSRNVDESRDKRNKCSAHAFHRPGRRRKRGIFWNGKKSTSTRKKWAMETQRYGGPDPRKETGMHAKRESRIEGEADNHNSKMQQQE